MLTYTIVRVLEPSGNFRPVPLHLGNIEIRPPRLDTPLERAALEESKNAFGVHIDIAGIAMRIATVVQADSPEEADLAAVVKFEEVQDILDHMSFSTGLTRLSVTECGYIKNLSNGQINSRKRSKEGKPFGPFPSFQIVEDIYPAIDRAQYFWLSPDSEIKQCLSRSFYWSRKARWEQNKQLRTLFRWFAMEAIWMIGKDDDICPRIMWCIGFPTGGAARTVSRSLIESLQADPAYSQWRGEVSSRLGKIRDFRNDSVHAGFRPQDIPEVELKRYDHLAYLACPRVQGFAFNGIEAGLKTSQELFDYLPLLFEKTISPIQMHGTILPLLARPSSP